MDIEITIIFIKLLLIAISAKVLAHVADKILRNNNKGDKK